jgi:hypothetical protein
LEINANDIVKWAHVKKAVNQLLNDDEQKRINLVNATVYKITGQPIVRIDIKINGEVIR